MAHLKVLLFSCAFIGIKGVVHTHTAGCGLETCPWLSDWDDWRVTSKDSDATGFSLWCLIEVDMHECDRRSGSGCSTQAEPPRSVVSVEPNSQRKATKCCFLHLEGICQNRVCRIRLLESFKSNQIYKCKWKVQVGRVEYSWNHYWNEKGFLCVITDFVLGLIALLTFRVKTSAKLAGGGSIKRWKVVHSRHFA